MISIVKASGEKAIFNPSKLRSSLKRVGAERHLIEKIVNDVSQRVTENMSTREIYRFAFQLLRKESRTLAAKYHLKNAIKKLGESGYSFEKYVAEIFRHQGYAAKNNQIIK